LPSVPVIMSTRSITPQCSCVPRPVLPIKPTAWLSSTITKAPYWSAKSQIAFRLATIPSIENTPSVAMSLKRALWASFSLASKSSILLFS